MDEQIGELIS